MWGWMRRRGEENSVASFDDFESLVIDSIKLDMETSLIKEDDDMAPSEENGEVNPEEVQRNPFSRFWRRCQNNNGTSSELTTIERDHHDGINASCGCDVDPPLFHTGIGERTDCQATNNCKDMVHKTPYQKSHFLSFFGMSQWQENAQKHDGSVAGGVSAARVAPGLKVEERTTVESDEQVNDGYANKSCQETKKAVESNMNIVFGIFPRKSSAAIGGRSNHATSLSTDKQLSEMSGEEFISAGSYHLKGTTMLDPPDANSKEEYPSISIGIEDYTEIDSLIPPSDDEIVSALWRRRHGLKNPIAHLFSKRNATDKNIHGIEAKCSSLKNNRMAHILSQGQPPEYRDGFTESNPSHPIRPSVQPQNKLAAGDTGEISLKSRPKKINLDYECYQQESCMTSNIEVKRAPSLMRMEAGGGCNGENLNFLELESHNDVSKHRSMTAMDIKSSAEKERDDLLCDALFDMYDLESEMSEFGLDKLGWHLLLTRREDGEDDLEQYEMSRMQMETGENNKAQQCLELVGKVALLVLAPEVYFAQTAETQENQSTTYHRIASCNADSSM